MRKFAKNYLGDFERSSFAKIWTATSTLVGMFEADMDFLFEDMSKYERAYKLYFLNTIDLVKIYLKDLSTGLHEIDQAFDTMMQVR